MSAWMHLFGNLLNSNGCKPTKLTPLSAQTVNQTVNAQFGSQISNEKQWLVGKSDKFKTLQRSVINTFTYTVHDLQ